MKIFSPFHNLFYKSCVLPCPIIQWINHALIVKQVLLGCSNLMQWLNEMETLVGYGSMYICPSSSSIMPLKKLKKRYKYLKFRLGRKWTKCKCICLGILLPQSITGVKDNCRPHLLSHHSRTIIVSNEDAKNNYLGIICYTCLTNYLHDEITFSLKDD